MKHLIIIPDGCADEPQASLGNLTPLQAARKPHMDRVAQLGHVGLTNNVPTSLTPASDVATLSLFGYDPLKYYTGRAPLEAAAMGIKLKQRDWAVRCNLVTIENEEMRDFTAGHIGNDEGRELINALDADLGGPALDDVTLLDFEPGVSYRNLLILRNVPIGTVSAETKTQPPHDIPDRPIAEYLPKGPSGDWFRDWMTRSRAIFANHLVNQKRIAAGKRPATQIWLWGQGQAPSLPPFHEVYKKRGAIITAVDLVRGVGALLGWKRIDVPGATGYLDTDYAAKGRYAIETIKDHDLVCVHVEAPDEASHEGKADAKVKALEEIDRHIVGPLLEALPQLGEWRMLIAPDHCTFLRTRAHAHGAVPYALAGTRIPAGGFPSYDEEIAAHGTFICDQGHRLMSSFLA